MPRRKTVTALTRGFLNNFFKRLFGFAFPGLKRPPQKRRDKRKLDGEAEKPIFAADKREKDRIHHNDRGENRNIEIPFRDPLERMPECFGDDAKERQSRNDRENPCDDSEIVSVIDNGISIA